MGKIKKLMIYILTGLIIIFQTPVYMNINAETQYDKIFISDSIDAKLIFKLPKWENDYCTFPNLEIISTNQDYNEIKTIKISYSGSNTENAIIMVPEDIPGFTANPNNTPTLLTYNVNSQTIAEIQTFLRCVQYKCENYQSINIILSEFEIPNDIHYFPGTGHFYRYVSSEGISWIDAYKEALNSKVFSWNGYLAVITSEQEDEFCKKYLTKTGVVPNGWLGGTRYPMINMGTTSANFISTPIAGANDDLGYWYWACGPESCFIPSDSSWTAPNMIDNNNIPNGKYGDCNNTNAIFYEESKSTNNNLNKTARYSYAPWQLGEPSDSGNEGCLLTISSNGEWNDYANNNTSVLGYIVEYGDRLWGNSTDMANSLIASTDIGKQITIKYHVNEAILEDINDISDDIVYYNQEISSLPTPSAISGYNFLGWYTDPDNGEKVEPNDNIINLLSDNHSSELNLYAHWYIKDVTAPEIKSVALINDDGTYYNAGDWTNQDITATYVVEDPNVDGDYTSGVDIESYYISLDGGANYYNASASPPTGVTVNVIEENKLEFKVSLEGQFDLKIKAADKRNNYTESDIVSLKIDKTPPLTPTEVNSPAESYVNTDTPYIYGKGEAKCIITIKEDDKILKTILVEDSGDWSANLPYLEDGIHNLSIVQTDLAGNTSEETNITLKIDTTGPTGEIRIRENRFFAFLNELTFGMFFKDKIEISFIASDEKGGSGVKSLEYIITDSEFKTKQDAINSTDWIKLPEGQTSFNTEILDEDLNKFIIYERITDNAGNITCIDSNGVILYKDSEAITDELTFTKTSKNNLEATVKLNGNTIDKIVNSTNNKTLTEFINYEIKNSTIIFSYSYLDSLFAGEYFLNVYYKPLGENYDVAPTVDSDAQPTTQIKLIVKKDAQSKIVIDGINSPYTYGDNFLVNAEGGDSTGNITYISSDDSIASIDKNGQVIVQKVGKFRITAIKAADENYEETTTLSSEIVVNPKHVHIENLGVKDKIYDTTEVADINYDSNAIINGKLEQDDLTINFEKAKAYFTNKNAAANKKVIFSGFSLSGKDVLNYTLSNQPAQASATIHKRPVTIQGVSAYDKIYNGTTNTEINQIGAKIINNLDGNNLNLIKGTANFIDQYAGSHKSVKFEGFSLSGSASSNYIIATQPTSAFAAIYQKPITIQGISACSKTYDGTTNTEIMGQATFNKNDKIDGDDLTVISGTANFSDKNIGNDKPVYFDGFALAGSAASNYTLVNQPEQIRANISPKDLTITNLSVSDKVYDGLNIAKIDNSPSLEGIINGDDVSIVNGTPSFITLKVGENIPVEFTEFSIEGEDSENYYIKNQPTGITANITPKKLKIKNLKVKDKFFDGYDTAEFEEKPALDGVVGYDDVVLMMGEPSFCTEDVSQNIPITFSSDFGISGRDSYNYLLLPHDQVSANINPSETFNQIDPSTGFWIEAPAGVFPYGSRLIVEKNPENSTQYKKVFQHIDEDNKQFSEQMSVYKINVVDIKGKTVKQNYKNDLVTVRIPISDNFIQSTSEIYKLLFEPNDTDFNEQVVKINGNYYCELKTNHINPYIPLISNRKNNNNSFIIIISVLISILLLAVLSIYIYKKFKKPRHE